MDDTEQIELDVTKVIDLGDTDTGTLSETDAQMPENGRIHRLNTQVLKKIQHLWNSDDSVVKEALEREKVDLDAVMDPDKYADASLILEKSDSIATKLPSLKDSFEVGKRFAGGMQGDIYEAFDKQFYRTVAIKTLHKKFASTNSLRNKFIWEARITGQLEHPSIIPTHGLYTDEENGLHLAMKLINGETLRVYLDKTAALYENMTPKQRRSNEHRLLMQRLEVFQQVCEAISYAHYRKVIHRDLKPENIMIGAFNEVYVMDWGIAEYQSGSSVPRAKQSTAGTIGYVAPEILHKQPYDSRSDIFSLGMILYEMVFLDNGYGAHDTKTMLKNAQSYTLNKFEHKFGCHVSPSLRWIVMKAMEYYPDRRYQNVQQMCDDIRSYRQFDQISGYRESRFSRLFRLLNKDIF